MSSATDSLHLQIAPSEPIQVVAGILLRGDRILICQRHHSDPYGLEWEFPGGKVQPGERLAEALGRELKEELAIEARIGPEVYRLRHHYPDRYVEVVFFRVDAAQEEPRNQVFETIAWVSRNDLMAYRFLEADAELVQRIVRGEIV